jgi:hypothetical protein
VLCRFLHGIVLPPLELVFCGSGADCIRPEPHQVTRVPPKIAAKVVAADDVHRLKNLPAWRM